MLEQFAGFDAASAVSPVDVDEVEEPPPQAVTSAVTHGGEPCAVPYFLFLRRG